PQPSSTFFPYTTLFRSRVVGVGSPGGHSEDEVALDTAPVGELVEGHLELGVGRARVLDDERRVEAVRPTESPRDVRQVDRRRQRSEEHTSELQSRENLV